jgi:hypothetical protein
MINKKIIYATYATTCSVQLISRIFRGVDTDFGARATDRLDVTPRGRQSTAGCQNPAGPYQPRAGPGGTPLEGGAGAGSAPMNPPLL